MPDSVDCYQLYDCIHNLEKRGHFTFFFAGRRCSLNSATSSGVMTTRATSDLGIFERCFSLLSVLREPAADCTLCHAKSLSDFLLSITLGIEFHRPTAVGDVVAKL